jgi:hypothetical protein
MDELMKTTMIAGDIAFVTLFASSSFLAGCSSGGVGRPFEAAAPADAAAIQFDAAMPADAAVAQFDATVGIDELPDDGGTDHCPYLRPQIVGSRATFHRVRNDRTTEDTTVAIDEVGTFFGRTAAKFTVSYPGDSFPWWTSRDIDCAESDYDDGSATWIQTLDGPPREGHSFVYKRGSTTWTRTWSRTSGVDVPAGTFHDCWLLTEVSDDNQQYKHDYCRGAGFVRSVRSDPRGWTFSLSSKDW